MLFLASKLPIPKCADCGEVIKPGNGMIVEGKRKHKNCVTKPKRKRAKKDDSSPSNLPSCTV